VEELGDPIVSQGQGYKIAPPKGWKVEVAGDMSAINMFQYDLIIRQRLPQLVFSVATVPKSPDVMAREDFREMDAVTKNQSKLEMLREGPSKVGGVDAYDFVAKNTEKGEKDSSTVVYIMGRYVTVHNRSYRMMASCTGPSEQTLVSIVDKISGKMEFTVPTAATEPTAEAGRGEPAGPSSGAEAASMPSSAPRPALPGAAEPIPSTAPSSFNLPGMN
jgi:hypothetical protein